MMFGIMNVANKKAKVEVSAKTIKKPKITFSGFIIFPLWVF